MRILQKLCLLTTACTIGFSWQSGFGAEENHDFAKWEKEIAAFEQMDRTNPPPQGALLFIGSSTIRLWTTLPEDFPDQKVINRGFGGSEIVDSTHFSDRIVFPYEPRMIFFRAGGNDLWNGKSPEQAFADYQKFCGTVHAKLPDAKIAWLSWDHTPSRWKQANKEDRLNQLVSEYTSGLPWLVYIDTTDMVMDAEGRPRPELFRSDQLHLNAEGYKLLAEKVRPYLPR